MVEPPIIEPETIDCSLECGVGACESKKSFFGDVEIFCNCPEGYEFASDTCLEAEM